VNEEFKIVKEARRKKGRATPPFPVSLLADRRIDWANSVVSESFRLLYTEGVTRQAGSMLSILHLCLSALVEMGIEPDGLFQIVHDADVSEWWNERVDPSNHKPDSRAAAEEAIHRVLVRRTVTYVEANDDGQKELPFT